MSVGLTDFMSDYQNARQSEENEMVNNIYQLVVH